MALHGFVNGVASNEGKHFIMALISRTKRYPEKTTEFMIKTKQSKIFQSTKLKSNN